MSFEHPINPFLPNKKARALTERFGGPWSRARTRMLTGPTALDVTVDTGKALAILDDGQVIAAPFTGKAILPIDRLRSRTVEIWTNDASARVAIETRKPVDRLSAPALWSLASTQADADSVIQVVQYRRAQIESLRASYDSAGGATAEKKEAEIRTFLSVIDTWLNTWAPDWYDQKQWAKIVQTGQNAAKAASDVLAIPNQPWEQAALDLKAGIEDVKAAAKVAAVGTVALVALVFGVVLLVKLN